MPSSASSWPAVIAAHRFGLGEASFDVVAPTRRDGSPAQIGAADAPRGSGLLSTSQALAFVGAERAERRVARNPPPVMTADQTAAQAALKAASGRCRDVTIADAPSRLLTALNTTRRLPSGCNGSGPTTARGAALKRRLRRLSRNQRCDAPRHPHRRAAVLRRKPQRVGRQAAQPLGRLQQ